MTAYTATFIPQAWVNDYAVEVDIEGENEFDVTAEINEIIAKGKPIPLSDTDESDDLRFAKSAPQWVKDWGGPFFIYVTEVEANPVESVAA